MVRSIVRSYYIDLVPIDIMIRLFINVSTDDVHDSIQDALADKRIFNGLTLLREKF